MHLRGSIINDNNILPTLNEDQLDVFVLHIVSNNIINQTVDKVYSDILGAVIISNGKCCINFGLKEVIISPMFLKNIGGTRRFK